MILSKIRGSKRFLLKITQKTCYKGLKCCKFMWKRNKVEQVMEKIVASTYIEHKHKNTGNSVLIHPRNVEKQYY